MIDWRENFVAYGMEERCYIYCDTNASYASIHQHLEDGKGKPCVVANGNVSGPADAGSCLAISYEARERGVGRGASLLKAKGKVDDLVIYESCLPLYEIYGDLADAVLDWIVPANMVTRGSCDEVVVDFQWRRYPHRHFQTCVEATLDWVAQQWGSEVKLNLDRERRTHLLSLPRFEQTVYAICYLMRDLLFEVLGLPVSISVAPSISLAKALVDLAKPRLVGGRRVYRTFHDAIAFPRTAQEANAFLRRLEVEQLCGVQTIARRLATHGVHRVADVQDHCGLDRTIRLARNLHLGKVVWYACHGRDEVLPGYLAAIREGRWGSW